MLRRELIYLSVLGSLLVAAASPTAAAPKKKGRGNKVSAAAVENARTLMASGDRDEVETGIQSLGLLGTAAAVPPLVERIEKGLPPDLLETAIITLMALGQPDAGPMLHTLATHRRATVRLRAVEALAAINPPGAPRTLLSALSDGDPKVRAAAATGLGDIGNTEYLDRLFLALDKGNLQASIAIGKLVKAAEVGKLLGYLGSVPFYSLGPALGEVLKRKDVTEKAKLEVVARLQEVGTPEVKGFLGDLIAAEGEAMNQRVSRAMLRAMQEIADR